MTHPSSLGTILVVDDNIDILRFAKRLLEIDGYTVITATDGGEGLCSYEEHQANIVLLLTDVVMPKINGFELADRVLRMDSRKPVLLMSGNDGCNYRDLQCLPKPFGAAELIEMVSRVLYGNVQPAERAASAA